MSFLINAWLDRANPFIELRNTQTGEVMAQFAGEKLTRCLEQGDVCLHDLCKADTSAQQELVRCLLLAHCANCLQGQLESSVNDWSYLRERHTHFRESNIVPFVARKVARH